MQVLTPETERPMVGDRRIHVLIPVYDDWEVLGLLMGRLDAVLEKQNIAAEVLVVDDGSSSPAEGRLVLQPLRAITTLRILELKRNLGHQRAIAVGLCHVEEHLEPRPLVVMDGDGEDDPADVPALLEAYQREKGARVVFAARHRRSEALLFQVFYRLFQLLHLLLTGRGIRIGNFSIVPPRALERLVVSSEIWSHYAAAITNTRVPFTAIPTARAKRIAGRSRMNFTALVVHGLSALSLYSHAIGVRLLVIAGVVIVAGLGLLLAAWWGGFASTGQFAFFFGLISILLQASLGGLLFVFLLLSLRQVAVVVPSREYALFVRRVATFAAPGAS